MQMYDFIVIQNSGLGIPLHQISHTQWTLSVRDELSISFEPWEGELNQFVLHTVRSYTFTNNIYRLNVEKPVVYKVEKYEDLPVTELLLGSELYTNLKNNSRNRLTELLTTISNSTSRLKTLTDSINELTRLIGEDNDNTQIKILRKKLRGRTRKLEEAKEDLVKFEKAKSQEILPTTNIGETAGHEVWTKELYEFYQFQCLETSPDHPDMDDIDVMPDDEDNDNRDNEHEDIGEELTVTDVDKPSVAQNIP